MNGIIREMIKEFFPGEHCSESQSTRTLLVQIQRVIRQKNEENEGEVVENDNNNDNNNENENGEEGLNDENARKSKEILKNLDTNNEDDLNNGFNKGDEEEVDMENEIEEYRMIIKHMEIALKDKEKEIKKLNKMLNGKEPVNK